MQRRSHHNDGESLQTDVMRFMAIIAFCLIAVLALVKSVETETRIAPPAPVEEILVTRAPLSIEQTDNDPADVIPPPAVEPEPVEPPPVIEPVAEKAEEPRLERPQNERRFYVKRPPEPTPEPEPAPEPEPVPEASPVVEPPAEPIAPGQTVAQRPETPAPSPAPVADDSAQGLSLRFNTHGDFLRLIARGDVALFAFNDEDVFTLGQDYRFRESRAPGRIYEIAIETIPDLVTSAFSRTDRDTADYNWGIRLPERIESQIENYLDTVESGVLLIDRYGDVRYVATS